MTTNRIPPSSPPTTPACPSGRPHLWRPEGHVPYRGQPFVVSEFGGIKWAPAGTGQAPNTQASWGYGEPPKSVEEFHARFAGQCRALLDNPRIFGFCYTQLTDVFQEQNGIFFFDRTPKFDPARIREALTQPAAIEGAPGPA